MQIQTTTISKTKDNKINDILKISRSLRLTKKIVIVDGQPGCGKTMLSPIIAALDRVELLSFAYELEYICALRYLGRIEEDAASTMARLLTDLKIYNIMMSREVNFRPADLSSIFRDAHPFRYLFRLFEEGDRQVPAKVEKENPILHLTTHNLTSICTPVFDGLGKEVVLIELVRHPLYMIKQQTWNMENLIGDVRDFTIYFNYKGKELPFYAYGWEDIFINSNPVEKAIYSIEKMYQQSEKEKELVRRKFNAKIITIPFERFVISPWDYMHQIENALSTKVTTVTLRVMKKQKVPRKMIADGINLKLYKRYGWQPPVSRDENEEFRLRRQFAVDNASKQAVEVLDKISIEYEERYLGGRKGYLSGMYSV